MTTSATAAMPELPRALRVWRWRVFAATWLCYVGFYFARKPYSIVKSDLGDALHFTAQDLALVYAAYLIAYTVGQFVSGAIGPRLGPRTMLLAGMAISVAAGVGFGVTDQLAWFVVLMTLNGLAQATGWSNCVGTMASWFHRGERGTVMGIWATNFQVGGVVANALAAYALAHFGFREAFFAGSIALLVVWVFFYFNQANKPEDLGLPPVIDPRDASETAVPPGELKTEAPAHGPGVKVRWSRNVWLTVLLVGGAYFGMKFIRYALWSWAPFVLRRNFGLQGDDAGYVSTLFDVCGIAGVVATGWLSDKVFAGRRGVISFVMLCLLVLATLGLFSFGAQSVTAFAICIGLVGFTLYGPDALLTGAGAMDIGSKDGAVRAAGIISGLGSAGSVVQELVIGKMYTDSGGAIGPVLGTLLGSALLATGCVAVILVRNRQGHSDV